MTEKLLALFRVSDDGLVTISSSEHWWVREWRQRLR